ncbi:hypothetical protein L484_009179 [Morus notabilis]|uniref:Uncharacterized protein n=1 Tax=Morus notabilis TaxID=981085 RepID=W9R9V9_9ROSA|nr:hypothetical protein L484_009179 [Morus notabilis]
MLEDMVEFDFWNLNCSRNNQGWENNSNVLEPWFVTQPQEMTLELETVFVQSIERMDKLLEEFKELNASIFTIEDQKGNIKDYLLKELTSIEEYMKSNMVLFDDDYVEPREFEPIEYIEP